jgi:hypothetical protein
VHRDKIAAFRGALARVGEAVQKTKWPVHFEFYELVNGGFDGTFVLAEPHANWADFEDKPDVKPLREMLKDAFGQNEADSVYERLESSIQSESSEILEFRPDLKRDSRISPGPQLHPGQVAESGARVCDQGLRVSNGRPAGFFLESDRCICAKPRVI